MIKNAVESLEESLNSDKKITILCQKQDTSLKIYITDNGVGILNENLTKIFSFGFTTKQTGHGYGIHNSALLAKELKG